MNRAYSLLNLKTVDEERRILRGIATTPSVDKHEDIVEPLGAQFDLPIPFLFQHDASAPVGFVTKATVKSTGIEVEVQLQKSERPGPVKDRLDGAFEDIRLGLVKGLSIGFRPLETARIEGSYGNRYLSWQWLELSAVTIASNGDCSIQSVKSADAAILRAVSAKRGHVAKFRPISPPAPLHPLKALAGHDPAFAAALAAAARKNAGRPLPVVRLQTTDPAILRRRAEADYQAARAELARAEHEARQRRYLRGPDVR